VIEGSTISHVRAASAIAILATLAGCDQADLCANDVVNTIASPGGPRSLVMFERDCGATTAFSSQVSLLPAGLQPSSAGNVLILDDDHGRIASDERGVVSRTSSFRIGTADCFGRMHAFHTMYFQGAWPARCAALLDVERPANSGHDGA